MSSVEHLRGELRRSLHGPAWHGPALLETLEDVDAAEAAARPIPHAHTIAELALHALGWIEEVTRRLGGAPEALPEWGDWPGVQAPDEASWLKIRDELARAGQKLDQVLSTFSAERLAEQVGNPRRDPPPGSGVSFAVMLHGLAQHNAYHGGQAVLLKRALTPYESMS